jgi:hypothetical protein
MDAPMMSSQPQPGPAALQTLPLSISPDQRQMFMAVSTPAAPLKPK